MTKLWTTGGGLISSTRLGGSINLARPGIALDPLLNVYVTGSAWSGGVPTTPGAFDRTLNGDRDAFVVKIRQ